MSSTFGKITISAGVRVLEDVGGTGLTGVLIGNESGLTCEVTLQGASVKRTLYPATVDFFEVPQGKTWSGNLQIDPMADLNNVSSYPGSYIRIDTFGINERPAGQYPMALPRNTNVGNTVTTAMGGSTSLQNDGNAANTVWAEATQSGGPASNVSATVDGSIQFNQWDGATKKLLFQTIANAAANTPSIKMLTAGLIAEVLGTLLIDNNISLNYKDNGGTSRRILQVDNNNNLQFFGITGLDFIQFLSSGGSVKFIYDLVNGLINVAGIKQTETGDTSGTFDIYEFLSGPIKIVIGIQTNFRQNGAAQFTTLKTAFTTVAFILNFGNGGVITGTGSVADTNRQITWGTGTAGGTQANNAQIPSDAAGFTVGGFTQVGNAGGYASAHGGICCWIGV